MEQSLKIDRFQNNLRILSKEIPLLGVYLGKCNPDVFSFCRTANNEPNLFHEEEKRFIHDKQSALFEAKECLNNTTLDNAQVLFIYGLGLGYFHTAAKTWLEKDKKHRLIFIEEDLSLLHCFLQTEEAEKLLRDSQVEIFFAGNEAENLFLEIAWKNVFQSYETFILPFYEKREESQKLYEKLLSTLWGVHCIASDVSDFGIQIFQNLTKNLQSDETFYDIKSLKNTLKDIPAVICGAGPSLDRHIPLLKEMQNKALIIAGGSAINILSKKNVFPHLVASLDPNPPYERYIQQNCFESPFFYLSRFCASLPNLSNGPKFFIPSAGGHLFESYFGEEKTIDAGWTVSNFCCSLALFLGCNPIVFSGMDLAYQDGKKYSGDINITKKEKVFEKDFLETKADFLMSKKWFEETASSYPDRAFFNTTLSGLTLDGIPSASLEEMNTALNNLDIKGLFQSAYLHAREMSFSEKRKKLLFLQESLSRCGDICRDFIALLQEKGEEGLKRKALYEVEIEEEEAYKVLLSPLWEIWKWVIKGEKKDVYLKKMLFFNEVCMRYREFYE